MPFETIVDTKWSQQLTWANGKNKQTKDINKNNKKQNKNK